jgi:hypothetical protein
LIGRGDEWATQADSDYSEHTGITFSDRLNTTQFAVHAARMLGGTITDTEVGVSSGVYDHVIEMKASNLDPQLKSSTIAFELGGYDLILAGMVGNNLQVQVQGGAAPTFSNEYVGTGDYDLMGSQTPALVLPDPAAQNYVGQRSQTSVSFNDGTSFDLTGLGRLDSANFQYSNNIVTGERRVGDPLTNATDENAGAVVRQLTRGDRSLTFSMGIYVAQDKRGYLAHLNNVELSAVSFKSSGKKIAATSYRHEVELMVTKSVITNAQLGGDRKGITNFTFAPLKDSGDVGILKIRIRNATATLV